MLVFFSSACHPIGRQQLFCLSALAEVAAAVFAFQGGAAYVMTELCKVELGRIVARVAPDCITAIAAIRVQSFEVFFVQQEMPVSGFTPTVWHDEFHREDAFVHVFPIIMDSGVVHFVFDLPAEKSTLLVVIIGVGSPTVENSDAFSVGL